MNLWNAKIDENTYSNPILHTDYSDPDVICVGEDYYMVASSFASLPGVPLLHSKNLVDWQLINYCVKSLPFERYNQPMHGCGTWAPSIRYHDNLFYVFVPLPDEGIFFTTAANPNDEWAPLKCIKAISGWIDPCPLWDDDGNVYMVHAFANSRCGIKNKLQISQLDAKTLMVINDGPIVFDGTLTQPTAEGPKFYKNNGWYYIFIPAGGVETGWQTVLRSKNIYGPYEEKIVMHQGNTNVNGPHQGGWVHASNGEDYFIHFQDAKAYGRIIHLQPMTWRSDWPFIGTEQNGDGIGEPVASWQIPQGEAVKGVDVTDYFEGEQLGKQWQWQSNPNSAWYKLMQDEKSLRLFTMNNSCRTENLLWYAPNALTQLLHAPSFKATTKICLNAEQSGDMCGIGIIGHSYSYFAIKKVDDGVCLCLVKGNVSEITGAGNAQEEIVMSVDINSVEIVLGLNLLDNSTVQYSYINEANEEYLVGKPMPVTRATWTGAKLALFALNANNAPSAGFADVKYFEVEKS